MKRLIFFILYFQISLSIFGQTFVIRGYVQDAKTSEKLIHAIVSNSMGNNIVETNEYGYFSIILQKKTTLSFSYLSYKKQHLEITALKDTLINIFLIPVNNEIDEVVIKSDRYQVSENEISTIYADINQIKLLPSLGGETDIVKAIQIFPGIQSGNEGTTGLYVRGGGPDQNLFLLDGVPLYNISHLFGFMSVFNADAISSIKIVKGGFPARYGGRLSSVIDVRMKDGNLNKLSGNFSLGLISAKFMLEGPVKKKKSSFLISARRTYIDGILNSIYHFTNNEDNIDKTNYYFYDITGKINYKFSDKNRLFLSIYTGNDKFKRDYQYSDKNLEQSDISNLSWGSNLVSLRHNYLFSKKVFLNTSLYYSYYKLLNSESSSFINKNDTSENQLFAISYSSDIRDFGIISDLDIYQSSGYHIKTGINGIRHYFLPGVKTYKNNFNGSDNQHSTGEIIPATELRAYFENKIALNNKFKFNIGINASLFDVQNKFYYSAEPRISLLYKISSKNSLKMSYSLMKQYLHLLTNSSFGLPTDLWVPPTSKIAPQKSGQYTLGFFQNLPANITLNIEIYYKYMKNLIAYKDNTSYFIESKDWESKVLDNGKGKSYGFELFCSKEINKIQLQLAYTLSKTTRQFDELNNGKEYSYKYDRRHDIALSFIYDVNKKITISANWVYGTGNAVTLPIAVYPSTLFPPSNIIESEDEGNSLPFSSIIYRNKTEIFAYGDRNAFRLPAYHRLDINIIFKKQKKRGVRQLIIGLYNAYNRKNPYYLTYAFSNDAFGDYNAKGEYHIVSLFPILPSLSYQFKF